MILPIVFTGFDSAWGGRAPGAICDLALQHLPSCDVLTISMDPLLVLWPEAVEHFATEYQNVRKHVVAIDQGLVVPNENGMRPVERDLARALMSKYRCGAHASNKGNRACYGSEAGIWKFVAQLEASGYKQSPESIARGGISDGHHYFECYPHPAIIGLFDLECTLQYKVHKKNKEDWTTLVEKIRGLATASLPIANVGDFVTEGFLQTKANEDKLDSIVAAYTAAWLWKYGWNKSMCIGDASSGYFVTPVSEGLRSDLLKVFPVHAKIDFAATEKSSVSKPVASPQREISKPPLLPDAATVVDIPTEALLRITDTGCLWGNANPWMIKDFCVGHVLEVVVLDIPEEPSVYFGPFANHGESLFGMRPHDEDSKLIWKHLAEGASKANVFELKVMFRYLTLQSAEDDQEEDIN